MNPAIEIPSAGRGRRLALGIASMAVSRGLGTLAPILMVPITLPALGNELFGVWMAVVSLTMMLQWADLGLGHGLMTRLSEALANRATSEARTLIANSYALLIGVSALLISILWATREVIEWPAILGVTGSEQARVGTDIAVICLTIVLINVPLSLIQRIQFARQQAAQSGLWQAFGALSSLGLAAISVQARARPVTIVALASLALPIGNLLNSAWFFGRYKSLVPRPRNLRVKSAPGLLKLGVNFMALSVLTSVALAADNFVVAHVLGPAKVAEFAIPGRILASLGMVITLVNLPFWPAVSEALARGELAWVEASVRKMIAFSGATVAVMSCVLTLAGPELLQRLGAPNPNDRGLLLALCFWWLSVAVISPLAMVQNAAGMIKVQFVGWGVFLLSSVPIKVICAKQFGLPAMVVGGTASYVLTVWPALWWGYRRALTPSQTSPQISVETVDQWA